MEFRSGSSYEGQFLKDKYHGQGTYKWNDGRKYTGQFVNGLSEGFGKKEFPSGA